MSIIEGIRAFIETCPHLHILADVSVDLTSDAPTNYAVAPGGDQILSRYIAGGAKHQYSFALLVREFTLDDVARAENNCFLEKFSEWVHEQCETQNFPDIGEDKQVTMMECANGFLYQLDESGEKGIYQLQCQLYYTSLSKGD